MSLIITILIFINSIEIIRIVRNNVDRENKERRLFTYSLPCKDCDVSVKEFQVLEPPVLHIMFPIYMIAIFGIVFVLEILKKGRMTDMTVVYLRELLLVISYFVLMLLKRWSCGIKFNNEVLKITNDRGREATISIDKVKSFDICSNTFYLLDDEGNSLYKANNKYMGRYLMYIVKQFGIKEWIG